ncbi:MAG: tripartite tricarboxylate transporter substrate binding protein, partial [Deltaproteobacteria bacterium]|nr:tripartite tricarboxylate transporter substrate binding protein [Deltaproteobacteria bacterium]
MSLPGLDHARLSRPWAAGGATDLTARILAPKMSKILGVPIQA